MVKVTPNPPDADPAAPSDEPVSDTPHNTAERAPSFADIKATPHKLCSLFTVNPEADTETLLAYACESLASANVMATDLVDHLEGTSRNALLGIAQVIMLGELTVNRVLDRLESPA
ncbi:hypothetical protein H7698_11685 [Pseudomonas sp. p50]|jgi:hypothetical protein|uniref:DUF6124 family protein n=1 Tax=Pseudomonas sp. p50(2008) TaxID=2816832 RepID=UPI00188BC098|nr:DUF6124 family protein [Pseudomonas sp. p50(2008)]MBF4556739.1 hypothetical protein [Pseudomonas sp. p50(2008)]